MNNLKLSKQDISILKRSLSYLSPYKVATFILFSCVISSTVIGIIYPITWGNLLLNLINKNKINFYNNIETIVFLYVVELVTSYFYTFIVINVNNDLTNTIKQEVCLKNVQLFSWMK